MSDTTLNIDDQEQDFASLSHEEQINSLRQSNIELKSKVALLAEQLDILMKGKPAVADASQVKTLPKESFSVGGQKYKFRVVEGTLPGTIGKRTALEILTDDQAYEDLNGATIKEWLVANNSKMVQRVED
jgi:hypothetical protein